MSDQHVLTDNVIFVIAQNAEKNVKKNIIKKNTNNSRILINLFNMSITLNKSSKSNSQQNSFNQNMIFLAQLAKSRSDVKITAES